MVIHEVAVGLSQQEEEELARAIAALFALAYEGFEDLHSHRCEACGHEWEHARPVNATTAQYNEAHRCPQCRRGPWFNRSASRVITSEGIVVVRL